MIRIAQHFTSPQRQWHHRTHFGQPVSEPAVHTFHVGEAVRTKVRRLVQTAAPVIGVQNNRCVLGPGIKGFKSQCHRDKLGSPDMGGLSADGNVIWFSGRYNREVYAIDAHNGKLLARIPVPRGPHGLCVYPQPGRYSLGHTGIFR